MLTHPVREVVPHGAARIPRTAGLIPAHSDPTAKARLKICRED